MVDSKIKEKMKNLLYIFFIISCFNSNNVFCSTITSNSKNLNTNTLFSNNESPMTGVGLSLANQIPQSHTTSHQNNESLKSALRDNPEMNNKDSKINNIKSNVIIDPAELACDIKHNDIVSFDLLEPTNVIYYTVISPRNPYYSFNAKLLESDLIAIDTSLKITNMEVYVDKSFREKKFIDEFNNSVSFRDRWVIATYLNKPVSNIELSYSYYSERAILINQIDGVNLLKLTFFNPYNQNINYNINLRFSGFKELNTTDLKLPYDSTIRNFDYKRNGKNYSNGVEISSMKSIRPFTQYELFMSLPMELKTCEAGFISIVYYSLIGVTVFFTIASLITVFVVSKE